LCRVFDQAPLASLAIAQLAFDNPERVFYFVANASLDLLQLVEKLTLTLYLGDQFNSGGGEADF
jgi:hypothetical protein